MLWIVVILHFFSLSACYISSKKYPTMDEIKNLMTVIWEEEASFLVPFMMKFLTLTIPYLSLWGHTAI